MAVKTYQYKPIPVRLQNQQIAAMRWLASFGLSPEHIRTLRWGCVDELKRTITIRTNIVSHLYDKEQGIIFKKIDTKNTAIPLSGTGLEWFFLKSNTPSLFWVFVKNYPKRGRWRANQQLEILYSTDEINVFIRDVQKIPENITTNLLTFEPKFATIEVAKLNFTNLENLEQTTI